MNESFFGDHCCLSMGCLDLTVITMSDITTTNKNVLSMLLNKIYYQSCGWDIFRSKQHHLKNTVSGQVVELSNLGRAPRCSYTCMQVSCS